MRVRSLHAQKSAYTTMRTPWATRLCVNIAGDAEKEQLNRATGLLSDAPVGKFFRVIVSGTSCAAFPMAAATYSPCRCSRRDRSCALLLEGGLAELIFDTPLWLADNDRLVRCVIFPASPPCRRNFPW